MKQLKFGIVLNYISIGLTFVVGLVYTPILIRILGQADYGLYALAIAVAGYLTLLDLGIGNAIVRYIAQNQVIGSKEKEARLIGYFFKFFCYIGIGTLIIGLLISWNIQYILSDEFTKEQINTLQWMVFILTLNFSIGFVLNTFSAVLQAYQKYIYLKTINVISQIMIPVLSLMSLLYSPNVILLTIILTVVNILVLITNYIFYKKTLKIKLSFKKIENNFRKEILAYSFVVFLVIIADKIYWQTDQILLGILKNPETVAVFAIAIQFVTIFRSLSLAINGVFLPHITHIVSEENYLEKLNNIYINISKLQTFIIGLAFSGFILIGEEFITLWVGEDYLLAYILVIILMSTFSLDLIQNMGIVIMQAKGKYKFRAYVLIACSIINILISIPIIKLYGSVGTAIVTAIFVFLGNVALLNIYFHKSLGLNMVRYWKEVGKFILIVVLISYLGSLIKNLFVFEGWTNIIMFILLYMFLYITVLYFAYLSNGERVWIKKKFLNR